AGMRPLLQLRALDVVPARSGEEIPEMLRKSLDDQGRRRAYVEREHGCLDVVGDREASGRQRQQETSNPIERPAVARGQLPGSAEQTVNLHDLYGQAAQKTPEKLLQNPH